MHEATLVTLALHKGTQGCMRLYTELHENILGYMLEATQSYMKLHRFTIGQTEDNIYSLEGTESYNRLHKKVATIFVLLLLPLQCPALKVDSLWIN